MIEVEGLQQCIARTVVRGRRTKRIRVNDEGRPTGGEVYTRGGAKAPPAKKTVKKFI